MGGKSKENLQLRLWNLNICIEKVDAKEMLIDRDDISDDIIALGTRELEVEFKFQRRTYQLSFLFPPRHQSAPECWLSG